MDKIDLVISRKQVLITSLSHNGKPLARKLTASRYCWRAHVGTPGRGFWGIILLHGSYIFPRNGLKLPRMQCGNSPSPEMTIACANINFLVEYNSFSAAFCVLEFQSQGCTPSEFSLFSKVFMVNSINPLVKVDSNLPKSTKICSGKCK